MGNAPRNTTDFIQATEICVETIFTSRKAKAQGDRNTGRGGWRPRIDARDSLFTLDPRSILIEVKGHPTLKKPQPMIEAPKPHNVRKYCEFYK